METKKNNIAVIVIGLLIIATITIGGFYYYQTQNGTKTSQYQNGDISFSYPADWLIDENSSNDFTDVHLSNKEPSASSQCDETFVGMEIQIGYANDSGKSFEDFVMSDLYMDSEKSLGSLAGEITPITINGNAAFKAQYSGFESACGGEGYVIQQGDTNNYIWVGLYTSKDNSVLDGIVNSIKAS